MRCSGAVGGVRAGADAKTAGPFGPAVVIVLVVLMGRQESLSVPGVVSMW